LLRDRLGLVFDRPTLTRIHHTSGGNPLYALELGRALDGLEIPPRPGAPPGGPGTLHQPVTQPGGRLPPPPPPPLAPPSPARAPSLARGGGRGRRRAGGGGGRGGGAPGGGSGGEPPADRGRGLRDSAGCGP